MKKYLWVLVAVVAILALSANAGCTYNNEEELYGDLECDTVGVAYLASVEPIISANCYSCHSQANAPSFGSGINLEGYAAFKIWIDNGRLLGTIKHESGFSPMPKGAPKLSDCNISIIEAWVDAGALDN